MTHKNDVSFLIGDEMVLWEHQSTKNPNMPLRDLVYVAQLYTKYIQKNHLNISSTKPMGLPSYCSRPGQRDASGSYRGQRGARARREGGVV